MRMTLAWTTLWLDARDNRDALIERSMLDTRGVTMQANRCDDPAAVTSAVRLSGEQGNALLIGDCPYYFSQTA